MIHKKKNKPAQAASLLLHMSGLDYGDNVIDYGMIFVQAFCHNLFRRMPSKLPFFYQLSKTRKVNEIT